VLLSIFKPRAVSSVSGSKQKAETNQQAITLQVCSNFAAQIPFHFMSTFRFLAAEVFPFFPWAKVSETQQKETWSIMIWQGCELPENNKLLRHQLIPSTNYFRLSYQLLFLSHDFTAGEIWQNLSLHDS
jgi:hypothetical protein